MKFTEFKEKHSGGFYLYAAEDIPGFYKKGQAMYGNCDDMNVESWLYNPLNGIYTVRLKNK